MTRWFGQNAILLAALALSALAILLPGANGGNLSVGWHDFGAGLGFAAIGILACLYLILDRRRGGSQGIVAAVGTLVGSTAILGLAAVATEMEKPFSTPVWLFVLAMGLLAWRGMEILSGREIKSRFLGALVPVLFGLGILYSWEIVVSGFQIPKILLPSPSLIWPVIESYQATLWRDFQQTYLKAVIAGFAIGCGGGVVVALIVDRLPFMQRGLLPLGSMVSALPIIGVAPILVMWFGPDWHSKAAVVVVMTFFPMLVNTHAGLAATSAIELDLMRSYGARYGTTLWKVRLPNALPFIFNALKINSTLALIGAIVAEFFGSPTAGMGFRISMEIGRLHTPQVWATIAVAALAGSVSYGILALLERASTFWHPSYRRS
jgi:NitT/TauT family transport system permease protein